MNSTERAEKLWSVVSKGMNYTGKHSSLHSTVMCNFIASEIDAAIKEATMQTTARQWLWRVSDRAGNSITVAVIKEGDRIKCMYECGWLSQRES